MRRQGFLLLLIFTGAFGGSSPAAAAAHDDAAIRCLDCHATVPLAGVAGRFHGDLPAICLQCHKNDFCTHDATGRSFRHPMSIVPSGRIPADMPLDAEKKIGCITCHLFHDGEWAALDLHPYRLRRPPGPAFCVTCHERLMAR
jgi:hypothetical protein